MNLYDRLTQDSLDKFNKERNEYPAIIEFIEKNLKSNEYVINLKYEVILHIGQYILNKYEFYAADIYALFID